MYEQDLALNFPQEFICHKTQPNQQGGGEKFDLSIGNVVTMKAAKITIEITNFKITESNFQRCFY